MGDNLREDKGEHVEVRPKIFLVLWLERTLKFHPVCHCTGAYSCMMSRSRMTPVTFNGTPLSRRKLLWTFLATHT